MDRRQILSMLYATASARLPQCPSKKRRIVQPGEVPTDWHEKPLRCRDHWGGGVRKDGGFNFFVRPTFIWQWLNSHAEGGWLCTDMSVWFENPNDARMFMMMEWHNFSRFVVVNGLAVIYVGSDIDEAMLCKISAPGRELWELADG